MILFQFIRRNIPQIAALVCIGLAINTMYGRSLVTNHYAGIGIPPNVQGAILIVGAVVLWLDHDPEMFILGSLPYAIYALTTVYLTLRAGAGYGTSLVFIFSYTELVALYLAECGDNG